MRRLLRLFKTYRELEAENYRLKSKSMDLTEDLKALRNALPYGAIQRIADKLGRSRYHVESVFLQRYQDDKVIEMAIAEVKKVRDHQESIRKNIREVLV